MNQQQDKARTDLSLAYRGAEISVFAFPHHDSVGTHREYFVPRAVVEIAGVVPTADGWQQVPLDLRSPFNAREECYEYAVSVAKRYVDRMLDTVVMKPVNETH